MAVLNTPPPKGPVGGAIFVASYVWLTDLSPAIRCLCPLHRSRALLVLSDIRILPRIFYYRGVRLTELSPVICCLCHRYSGVSPSHQLSTIRNRLVFNKIWTQSHCTSISSRSATVLWLIT